MMIMTLTGSEAVRNAKSYLFAEFARPGPLEV